MKFLIFCITLLSGAAASAQDVSPQTNAPSDRPKAMQTDAAYAAYERAIAPYIAEAKRTYPDAKRRFLSGELSNRPFFVTVRLSEQGRYEDSFVRVLFIDDKSGDISGKIANEIQMLHSYHNEQRIILHEADVRDWTIANPDGSQEGNVVGKFLETYQPQ